MKRQDPNAPIHPSSHPHIELWRQVPGLFADGVYFSRVTASSNVGFLAFLGELSRPMLGLFWAESLGKRCHGRARVVRDAICRCLCLRFQEFVERFACVPSSALGRAVFGRRQEL